MAHFLSFKNIVQIFTVIFFMMQSVAGSLAVSAKMGDPNGYWCAPFGETLSNELRAKIADAEARLGVAQKSDTTNNKHCADCLAAISVDYDIQKPSSLAVIFYLPPAPNRCDDIIISYAPRGPPLGCRAPPLS